jgi:hypothetical protein
VQGAQPGLEVGAQEAGGARDLGGERGERLLRERVAVDPDQRPRRADALGDQAGVAAGAERAVDHDVAGARVERVDQLARQHGDVGLGHVKQDGQVAR